MRIQNTSLIGLNYKNVGILLGVCLTWEELVGDNYTGDDGVGFIANDYCFFPFTHFILMFPFLSNNERF
jgi:hypothetical protein